MSKFVDTIIIGAGIGGIGYGVHLKKDCPNHSLAILEGRNSHGGTWDLFKYPGIRSDSDMCTFAYSFHPWRKSSYLSPASATLEYLEEVIDVFKLRDAIRYKHKVKSANFDTESKLWNLVVDADGDTQHWQCRYIVGATGYYDYENPHRIVLPKQEVFKGDVIHPQHWPENYDYTNKKVVVIGSGATALTVVPSMAKGGAQHVTMLQRSPSYVLSVQDRDLTYAFLRHILPEAWAFAIVRLRNQFLQWLIYAFCMTFPAAAKWVLLAQVKFFLGKDVDMKDWTPRYNPWEERLCIIPDGDIFKEIRKNKVAVVTDHIDHLDANGIVLQSGRHLDADLIVMATGLNLKFLNQVGYSVDGKLIRPIDSMLYRGVLVGNLPNYFHMLGYTNMSWTLKVDLAADYAGKLIKYMDVHQYKEFVAVPDGVEVQGVTVFPLEANYIKRCQDNVLKQGDRYPWINKHDSYYDRKCLAEGAQFNDKYLKFYK